jgi:hypothetical protein
MLENSSEADSHHEGYSRLGGSRRRWSAFADEGSEAFEQFACSWSFSFQEFFN